MPSGILYNCSDDKIKVSVTSTTKMSLYQDVGNEFAIIEVNRWMSYT